MDAEDLRKGWLVNRVFKQGQEPTEEDEAEAGNREPNGNVQPKVNRWGPRGISVSVCLLCLSVDGDLLQFLTTTCRFRPTIHCTSMIREREP